jgi:ketosteroid isomerase-like protein
VVRLRTKGGNGQNAQGFLVHALRPRLALRWTIICAVDRSEAVRTAFELFNRKDFEGVLEFFDPDVEISDLLHEGALIKGRDVVRQQWTERFDQAQVATLVGDLIEVGDTVFAAVCMQAYTKDGAAFVPQIVVASRFTFRGDRIVRMESRVLDEIPDDVRALFHAG